MILPELVLIAFATPVAAHLALVAGAVTACYATSVMLVRSGVKGKRAWSTARQGA